MVNTRVDFKQGLNERLVGFFFLLLFWTGCQIKDKSLHSAEEEKKKKKNARTYVYLFILQYEGIQTEHRLHS